MLDADCLVVGAGFAGLRAGRDLRAAGARVIVLEARGRVGGRTFTRPFAGEGPLVELGGSWFTPEHREAPAELARYGLGVRTYDGPRVVRWRTGGVLRFGLPVPFEELGALEAALVTLRDDALQFAAGQARGLGELSVAAYLDRLAAPVATRDLLRAWWTMIAGTAPADGAVADALSVIAGHGGVTGMLTALRHAPVEGWSALAQALAAGLDVRLAAPVELLRQDAEGVEAVTAGGVVRAAFAICAVPVNVLPYVAFEPALPPVQAEAAGSNAGRAVKLWVRVRGLAEGSLSAGAGEGVDWLYADRTLPGGDVLALGFGVGRAGVPPADAELAERAVRAFWPEAEIVAADAHDWVGDPWSRGTWATAMPGAAHLLSVERFPPHGRILFAGADIAPREAGWIEGALISGAEAARALQRLLVAEGAAGAEVR